MNIPVPTNRIRILAIDPGVTVLGWALLCYDLVDGNTVVSEHSVLTGQRLLKERKAMQDRFSKSFIVLEVYYQLFCQLIEEHRPDYVVSEGAFYHRFAHTYASLTLVIHTLRRACHDKLGCDIYEVAPMETKKTVTGNNMADKSQIKSALQTRQGLTILETVETPLEEISEHEYDAIGHGLAFIAKELPTVLASQTMLV